MQHHTKESYERYLDKIINKYQDENYIVQDLLDIKKRVIQQRFYKNWDIDKIASSINYRYSICMYGVKEPPANEKLYAILQKVIEGAIYYESYRSEKE